MRVLGIDPALSTTGYAVIESDNYKLITADKIVTPKHMKSDDDRIELITEALMDVFRRNNCDCVMLEDGFLGANAKTGIQLAMLRGAIIGIFRFNRVPVKHMLPSEIRKLFGLSGSAKKIDVALHVLELYRESPLILNIGPYSDKQNKDKTSDIYDAISIARAYCIKINQGGT